MIQDFLSAIVSVLIVNPLQAEMIERLAQIRAPQAVITDMRACAESSLPQLADRAWSDPVWVVTATVDVWIGRTAPEEVFGGTSAQCNAAVKAARVYRESRGA